MLWCNKTRYNHCITGKRKQSRLNQHRDGCNLKITVSILFLAFFYIIMHHLIDGELVDNDVTVYERDVTVYERDVIGYERDVTVYERDVTG